MTKPWKRSKFVIWKLSNNRDEVIEMIERVVDQE